MRKIYKKIKKNYKNIDIEFNEKDNYLIIKRDNLKIEADLSRVDLFKSGKEITHMHPNDYKSIYNYIALFLDDSESIQRRVTRENRNRSIILVIFVIIFSLLQSMFDIGDKILIVLGCIVGIVCFATVIHLLFKNIYKRHLLKKVEFKDLELIVNYESLQNDWGLAQDYNVFFEFEDIDFICMDFLDMKKELHSKVNDLLDEEFEKNIKKCKNKDLNEWYNKAKEVIFCIYKYYDENGKRKF